MTKFAAHFTQYNTNIGYFVTPSTYMSMNAIVLNEGDCKMVPHAKQYYKLSKPLYRVQSLVIKPRTLTHYQLSVTSEQAAILGIPLTVTVTDDYEDDDGPYPFGVDAKYHSLYTPVYSEAIEELIDLPFVIDDDGGYFEITEPTNFVTREINIGDKTVPFKIDIENVATYDEIVKILTPGFAMHCAPLHISSAQMYKIVRSFIKENINRKVAQITSDYDFCFTVKKIVNRKPVVVAKKKTVLKETFLDVFEMTYSGYRGIKGYEGYTCIAPMHAKNAQDLYTKLTDYLQQLIELINSDITECSHCSGTGHIVKCFSH